MAIAFDTSTQGTAGGVSGGGTQSYSHSCTGTNLILYVHVYTGASADSVSSVTYNSVAMTRVGFVGGSNYGAVYLYRLVNPTSGSNSVVITYSGTPAFGVSVATSYTGAKQSGGVFVSNTNTTNVIANTSLTVVLTPNSASNWIVCANGNEGAAPFTATNSAFIRQIGSNVAVIALDTNGTVSAVSTTLGITVSGNGALGLVAESFEPVGGAASPVLPYRTLLGVGI